MDDKALGRRLHRIRIRQELSLEQLGFLSNLSPSFIGNIERGRRSASIESVIALSNALEITPSHLLQDSLDDPFSYMPASIPHRYRETVMDIIILAIRILRKK